MLKVCIYLQLEHEPPQKKSKKSNTSAELISLACQRLQHPPSEYEKIALAWAVELQKMQPQQQLFAKKAINEILFEGQMGTLQRDSVQINLSRTSTPYSSVHPSPIIYQYDPLQEQPSASQLFSNFQ